MKGYSGSRALFALKYTMIAFMGLWICTTQSRAAPLNAALSQICYDAINRATARIDVPREVMLAITLTETGRNLEGRAQPWPWTVNMEGAGHWFEDRPTALAYVKKEFARGARSFDVGCFQINYKWHHQHFRSIEDMFDPIINATYAAKYLSELYAEKGNWPDAAGAYHSRTPKFATRYSARFERYLARIAAGEMGPALGGHGSEPIVASAPTQNPQGSPPLLGLLAPGRINVSSTVATRGGLVSKSTTQGLLTRANGALY